MTYDRAKSIYASEFTTALSKFVRRYTVALSTNPDPTSVEVGSGTCLKIGKRYFVLTAAHVLRGVPLSNISVVHSGRVRGDSLPLLRVGLRGGGDYEATDVGYIEIEESVALQMDREFLALDRVELEPEIASRWLFLYGFPTKLLPLAKAAQGRYEFNSIAQISVVPPLERYPDSADPNLDIVFEYPEEGLVGPTDWRVKVPDPGGTSGGSIWVIDPNEATPLAGPHNAKWIAIQRAWVRSKRIAYGNRIQLALDALAEDYPDIAPSIAAKS